MPEGADAVGADGACGVAAGVPVIDGAVAAGRASPPVAGGRRVVARGLEAGFAVVVIVRPIVFDEQSPSAMYRHLDRWASTRLATPEEWASMVERCGQWADYSPATRCCSLRTG